MLKMTKIEYNITADGNIQLISDISHVIPQNYKNTTFGYEEDYYNSCEDLLKAVKDEFTHMPPLDSKLSGDYAIYVLLHVQGDLISNQICKKPDRSFRGKYDYGQRVFIHKKTDRLPILHFCKIDLFNEKTKLNGLLRNFFIMDSSIWNFFIQYEREQDIIRIDNNRLKTVIERISRNTTQGLYNLNVSLEYAEFNARKTRESYLRDGDHAVHVSPFVFHSEKHIENLINDRFKLPKKDNPKPIIDLILDYKWRILLVDDKANSPMSPYRELDKNRLDTKLRIIESRLASIFHTKSTAQTIQCRQYGKDDILTEDCVFCIEYVENISKAKEALQNREYDIILLDYLLDKGENGGHEYGYDLLNDINSAVESHDHNYLIGPKDCFFFMFISAYPTAVQERLLAEGLNPHEDYWNINVGACPTNTPQLFSYNLLKFMERRLERLGISKLSPTKIIQQIHEIFSPTEGKTVREMADERYRDVLSLQYHYSKMVKDVEIPKEKKDLFNIGGSVLVTDFIQQKGWLKGFLEHLSHLVYLVAFGTTRQWAEMWEEYLYIRPQLNKLQSSCETKTMIVTKCIEQYISQLKRQQR